jgi:hypothetical protein
MKTEHDDSPATALAQLERTVPGEDHAPTELSHSAGSGDIGELFLAELEARRERLRHWISLLSEEARLSGGRIPMADGSRHKCRGPRLPSRAARRLRARGPDQDWHDRHRNRLE